MQNELLKIIDHSAANVKESNDKQTNINIKIQDTNNGKSINNSPLLEFLITIFERFQQVIASHSTALCGFAHVIKKHNLEVPLYEMTDVWNNIQAVVSRSLKYKLFEKFFLRKKYFTYFFNVLVTNTIN